MKKICVSRPLTTLPPASCAGERDWIVDGSSISGSCSPSPAAPAQCWQVMTRPAPRAGRVDTSVPLNGIPVASIRPYAASIRARHGCAPSLRIADASTRSTLSHGFTTAGARAATVGDGGDAGSPLQPNNATTTASARMPRQYRVNLRAPSHPPRGRADLTATGDSRRRPASTSSLTADRIARA
jgi:hypothetical protein